MYNKIDYTDYRKLVSSLTIGKKLPDSVYVHESALDHIPGNLASLVLETIDQFQIADDSWNIIKFYKKDYKITYLNYPDFEDASYPQLKLSQITDLEKRSIRRSDYSKSENPPILHRKETFVTESYPLSTLFKEITSEGEAIGLYEKTSSIGFKKNWEKLIKSKGYYLDDKGRLQPLTEKPLSNTDLSNFTGDIERHKTAIDRNHLSKPMQALSRHDYLNGEYSVLDYGCGKGDDIRELEAHGIDAIGWDPVHRPETILNKRQIVNLGFVINVIENNEERTKTLHKAWDYTSHILVVAVMIAGESKIEQFKPYKDGIITKINTFQKYYSQGEIRYYIENTLSEKATPVGQGIFFIFKDKKEEQRFLANRQYVNRDWNQITQRQLASKPKAIKKSIIEKHIDLFTDYWNTTLELGRIPANDEFEYSEEIRRIVGSRNKAHQALLDYFDKDTFNESQLKRKDDLLVYFALSLFDKRKPQTKMPESLKRDIKVFFMNITSTLEIAKELLFSVGRPEVINKACKKAYKQLKCGNMDESHSFTFQAKHLGDTPVVLRAYIGCAIQLYGDIGDIHLIKAHVRSGKVSLMRYDDWDKNKPLLVERIKIRLRDLDIDFFDYGDKFTPPPLLNKDSYLVKQLI